MGGCAILRHTRASGGQLSQRQHGVRLSTIRRLPEQLKRPRRVPIDPMSLHIGIGQHGHGDWIARIGGFLKQRRRLGRVFRAFVAAHIHHAHAHLISGRGRRGGGAFFIGM